MDFPRFIGSHRVVPLAALMLAGAIVLPGVPGSLSQRPLPAEPHRCPLCGRAHRLATSN